MVVKLIKKTFKGPSGSPHGSTLGIFRFFSCFFGVKILSYDRFKMNFFRQKSPKFYPMTVWKCLFFWSPKNRSKWSNSLVSIDFIRKKSFFVLFKVISSHKKVDFSDFKALKHTFGSNLGFYPYFILWPFQNDKIRENRLFQCIFVFFDL